MGSEVSMKHEVPTWPNIDESAVDSVAAYLRQGNSLSISEREGVIADLEDALEATLGLSHVVTTSSGTSALHDAYVALDLPRGSEVITAVSTFHASVSPAMHCGLTPVLVDVDPLTGNLGANAIESALTKATRVVVVTHLWGEPADMDAIVNVCKTNNLYLIEDCSHAYLSKYKGRPVGTFGDISAWSMQASKAIPAGEGGFLSTSNPELLDRAILAGHYRGRAATQVRDPTLRAYSDTGFGLKHRLHPLVAVLALSLLKGLPSLARTRQEFANRFDDALVHSRFLRAPFQGDGNDRGALFGYKPEFVPGSDRFGRPVECDQFLALLSDEGVDVHRPSIRPLSEMPLFQGPSPMRGASDTWHPRSTTFPGCEEYFANRVSLPVFSRPDDEPLFERYLEAITRVEAALSGA